MYFIHSRDEKLRAQLVEAEVLSDGDLASFMANIRAESGHLFEDVLLPNADRIDATKWIYWMVKTLGLNRINSPSVTEDFLETEGLSRASCADFLRWQVYPIGRTVERGDYIVAVGRPDYLAEAQPYLGERPTLLAASPSEISAISKVYRSHS